MYKPTAPIRTFEHRLELSGENDEKMNGETHLEHWRDDLSEIDSTETSHEVEISDLGHGRSPQLIESECSDEEDSHIRAMEAICVKASDSLK